MYDSYFSPYFVAEVVHLIITIIFHKEKFVQTILTSTLTCSDLQKPEHSLAVTCKKLTIS